MGSILVGCCSWTDKSLIDSGRFYPPEVKTPEERLRYYASQFPLVEVDSSYYALPDQRTAALWVERTPENFTFNVKAFRAFTGHQTPLNAFPRNLQEEVPAKPGAANTYYRDLPQDLRDELWRRFADALLPLDSAGKLGVVLFQYPPWFSASPGNLEFLVHCREMLPQQFSMAAEFRNAAWLDERSRDNTLRFLRDNRLAFVCVDGPQGFKSSIPPIAQVTTESVGLVRFHGRNAATWEARGASSAERFDWYYADEELTEWVPKIGELSGRVEQVQVLMNTNRFDQGPANARRIAALMVAQGFNVGLGSAVSEQGLLRMEYNGQS
jgi:uncharacterized protein YecE (DUF72 family)